MIGSPVCRAGAAAALGLLLAFATSASALPDLREGPRDVDGIRFYPDHENPRLYYYLPGEIELSRDASGKPKLRFLQLRYVGNATYGNEGEAGSASTLTLPMRLAQPSPQDLAAATRRLEALADVSRVQLRPLPVTRFQAFLAYAPVSEAGVGPAESLPSGQFEAGSDEAAQNSSKTYWSERVYTLEMNAATSQLMWTALHDGLGLLSVGYVFYSEGQKGPIQPELSVELADALPPVVRSLLAVLGLAGAQHEAQEDVDALRESLAKKLQPAAAEGIGERMVHAGTTTIRVDARRWPDLFQRVDFNEELPPGYASIKVYCYDFKDQLRPELAYKKVEIEATSVAGRPASVEAKFLRRDRDVYATRVRFPVAVRLDRPYRYRVIAAHRNGTKEVGSWQDRPTWGGILDITTRPDDEPSDAPNPEAHG